MATTKKKKKTAANPKSPKVKRATKRKVKAAKVARPKKSAATLTTVQRGQAIINKIEALERERAKQKDKDSKDFYSLAINAEHKKLRKIGKNLK